MGVPLYFFFLEAYMTFVWGRMVFGEADENGRKVEGSGWVAGGW